MEKYNYAIGRRKTSVATVRLFTGKGISTINEKGIELYKSDSYLYSILIGPFVATGKENEYYYTAKVNGGGIVSQLEAVRLALSRALVKIDNNLKPILKIQKYLTRDSRIVERKKVGRVKARKSPQYSKR